MFAWLTAIAEKSWASNGVVIFAAALLELDGYTTMTGIEEWVGAFSTQNEEPPVELPCPRRRSS